MSMIEAKLAKKATMAMTIIGGKRSVESVVKKRNGGENDARTNARFATCKLWYSLNNHFVLDQHQR